MSLKGKKVYMTGGTGGLGRPLTILLEEAGSEVIWHDREKDGDLAGNLDTLCEKLAAESPPDILINLAGVNMLDWCENQDSDLILNVNLHAPIRLTQAVLPAMKKRGTGQIVNVGSMTGLIPLPYYSCYVASKAGLKGFNDALRRELWGSGITLTHIAPRAVKTAMNEGAIARFNEYAHIHTDDAEKIATRIFRAIEKGEKDVRIGWPEKFYAFMSFILPGIIDRGLENHRKAGLNILNLQYPPSKKEKNNEKNMAA